jgi:ferredoxin
VFAIAISATSLSYVAAEDETLLEAAGRAGIVLPSSCRNGTCRTCMCTLVSGRIAYRIEWPGLSADEKLAGTILPCVAYPRSDLILIAPAATRAASAKSPLLT